MASCWQQNPGVLAPSHCSNSPRPHSSPELGQDNPFNPLDPRAGIEALHPGLYLPSELDTTPTLSLPHTAGARAYRILSESEG